MTKVAHHSHHVILDVAKIQTNVSARGDAILLIAAFSKTFDDIGLPAEKAHQGHHFLTAEPNLAQKLGEIITSSNKDLVFDRISFNLDFVDWWSKGINNVVTNLVVNDEYK